MKEGLHKDIAKDMTLGQAINLYEKEGKSVIVNDGKDITVIIEEEK